MPTFEIEQYAICSMRFLVEAATEAEAIAALFNWGTAIAFGRPDNVSPANEEPEFVGMCKELGLPSIDHRELSMQLRAMGISGDQGVIPSIRSITKIERE